MKTSLNVPKHPKKNGQEGFTLVEIMVVVALSAIIFYGIFAMLRMGSIQANVAGVRMTINGSAREGMTRVLQELREASPDSFSWGTNTVTFSNPETVNDDGSITWSDPIEYSVDGTQLLRTQAGQVSVVANDVQSVTFTGDDEDDPSIVTVEMVIQRQTVQGRTYSETITGQGQVRNV